MTTRAKGRAVVRAAMQPIVWDGRGVIRFKENLAVSALLDAASNGRKLDLNDLAIMQLPDDDMMQLAQLSGYSVSGFGDLNYADRRVVARADAKAARLAARAKGRKRGAA